MQAARIVSVPPPRLRQLLQDGLEHLARRTPRRLEIDHHRGAERHLNHLVLEIGLGYVMRKQLSLLGFVILVSASAQVYTSNPSIQLVFQESHPHAHKGLMPKAMVSNLQ